jgi:hypothetical protein
MLTINGAGSTAADPLLAGLTGRFAFAASSMDVAVVDEAALDQASGFPGTNSVKSSLSPAAATMLAGTGASYDDTLDQLNLGSTTGLSAGGPLYLSHAGISAGVYIIASVVDASKVTLRSDPFANGGNKTGVSFQTGWSYESTFGSAPSVSSLGGTQNYFKAKASDSTGTAAQLQDSFYVRNAPSGTGMISLGGMAYTGGTVNTPAISLSILAAWANKGGIATVALASHSAQGVNNFTWTVGGGISERSISSAETSGLTIAGGDGVKYGRVLLRTFLGSTHTLGFDISLTLDTTGPALTLTAYGV